MTDQITLEKLLTSRTERNWVNRLSEQLVHDGFVLADLLELTLHADGKIAFHAVWLLDTLVTHHLNTYAPSLTLLIAYSQKARHHSCHRQYARIFMFLTLEKAPADVKQIVAQTDMEPVVEQCFDWMIDPKVKVTVKAFASQTLFNMRHRYNWIAEELASQLQHLMKNGSPAIQTTGHRLLNELQK